MAVHGTRRGESVSWDYEGLLQLLSGLARERSGLPVLRCYWYEATVDGRRTAEQDALADVPGIKLRIAKIRPGRREGVETEIHRDLTTLARNNAISDALVVSAEEDLAQVIADVQDLGMRVTLVHIAVDGNWTISRALRQESDDIIEISGEHLRPYVELIAGAEPVHPDEDGDLAVARPLANGHSTAAAASYQQVPAASANHAPPAIYTAPVVAEYQRPALQLPRVSAREPREDRVREDRARDDRVREDRARETGSGKTGRARTGSGKTGRATTGPVRSGPRRRPSTAKRHPRPVRTSPHVRTSLPVRTSRRGRTSTPRRRPARGTGRSRRRRIRPRAPAPPKMPSAMPRPRERGRRARRSPDRWRRAPRPRRPRPASCGACLPRAARRTRASPGPWASPDPVRCRLASTAARGTSARGREARVTEAAQARSARACRSGPYTGPQPVMSSPAGPGGYQNGGASLSEAVQAAHEEGQEFGGSVARDAPALWLEAVLARKPRMPSDLEARLLQGSALPIDFLLHDEVRHALRRGFWDALERTRR